MISINDITAVIIAGGKGSRLNGADKGLLCSNNVPFIASILTRIQPQVAQLCINANRNQTQYAQYGYPVFADQLNNENKLYQGPLAGIASAMQQVNTPYIITLPCDAPYPPYDLVRRLCIAHHQQHSDIALAHDGIRSQFLHALLPVVLQNDLLHFLQQGERRVGRWYVQHNVALADFSDQPDAFVNINTTQQYQQLEPS